jgi:hypothetical protein
MGLDGTGIDEWDLMEGDRMGVEKDLMEWNEMLWFVSIVDYTDSGLYWRDCVLN